jgi:N-acetylmuramoyl-L-alanine amidase
VKTENHGKEECPVRKSSERFSLVPLSGLRGYCFCLLALALIATGSLSLLSLPAPDEKHLTVYSTRANYSLPVTERSGHDYVGLLELLEPLGSVNAKTQSHRWKLRFNRIEGEFTPGKNRGRIHGKETDLTSTFVMENGRGLIPVASLTTVLPRFLQTPVTFHEGARRLFIGSVGTQFAATLSKTIPPRLTLNFTSPVNPTISTEPGRLRMVFTREPLVQTGTQTLTFADNTMTSATYQENNGTAEITVAGNQPLMAVFSNDGRSITVAPAPQASIPPPSAVSARPSAPTPAPTPVPPLPSTAALPAFTPSQIPPILSPAGPHHFLAVVDASHGGDERGAALTPELPEKDVTLSVAHRVRQELQNRGIPVLMLRDSDTTVGVDQRAALANMAQASVYICIHASSQGNGVRLYTAAIPAAGENRGPFVTWDAAQSALLPLSQAVLGNVAAELQKKTAVRTLSTPMRPLNNVTSPVFAVELAPPGTDVLDVASAAYQQLVASAIAAGVAGFRDRPGARP